MSRRDEALSAVDDLVDLFRSGMAQALEQRDSASTDPRSRQRPNISAPLPSAPGSTPFSAGASHQSYPLPVDQPLANGGSREARPPTSGDELPGYSRRAPVDPALTSGLPPKRRHVLASKTGKLHLELDARGKEHVVLVQEQPDGDVTLDGTLRIVLRDPEAITHVRVRLKGMVRTLVQKAHASGRHPVSDEVDFFEDGRDLWTAPTPGGAATASLDHRVLANNASGDPSKLQGTFTFPFSLVLPGRLVRVPGMDLPPNRAMRPPPSFVLDSSLVHPSGATTSMMTTGVSAFEASCRYYLKVTLGRKGLLKLNERWVIPVVFIPRQAPPQPPSPLRAIALAEGRRPPSSTSDPEGWSARGKYVARTGTPGARRGGLFKGGKSAWVEVEGRVPRPQKFVKGQGQVIDFEVHITSDANSGRFPASAVAVSLLQRSIIHAQNLVNALETVVLRAQAVRPIGAPDGLPVQLENGAPAWRMIYGGQITLTQGMTPSFRAPNLQVLYELVITIYQPSSRPGGTTHTQLATLSIPVEIISCVPAVGMQATAPPPTASAAPEATFRNPLPPPRAPSAHSVQQTSSTSVPPTPAAPAAPPTSEPNPLPPLPPRHTPASSTTLPPTPAAAAEEERRLEEEFGLPPSYFDVVAEEARRS